MNKVTRIKKLLTVLLLTVLLLICALLLLKPQLFHGPATKARVISVADRPNLAEDGYYGIEAKDINTGSTYSINADRYLNTPLLPGDRGEECIKIPKVSVGQIIEFNLPKVTNADTFINCYKKGIVAHYWYFFR